MVAGAKCRKITISWFCHAQGKGHMAEPKSYIDGTKAVVDPNEMRDPELRELVERLGNAMAKSDPDRQEPERKTAQIIQLPIWPEPARGTPNSFLRSALFAAIQGKGRRYMEKELLGSLHGFTVKYTGKQLDQSDLDVWEQAVHLARLHPLGHVCLFTANAFLKALGRSNGKSNYMWLHDVFTRLVACAVEIRYGTKVFTGNLLASCIRDEATSVYRLTINPDTIKLYGSAEWTGVEWKQRQALRGKPLALWLHGFYSTHAAAYPIKVDTLRELSGSRTKEGYKFKQNLKTALAELDAATGMKFAIEKNLVVKERKGE